MRYNLFHEDLFYCIGNKFYSLGLLTKTNYLLLPVKLLHKYNSTCKWCYEWPIWVRCLINSLSLNTFNGVAVSGQYVLIVGVTYQNTGIQFGLNGLYRCLVSLSSKHFHSSVFQRFHKVNLNILLNWMCYSTVIKALAFYTFWYVF